MDAARGAAARAGKQTEQRQHGMGNSGRDDLVTDVADALTLDQEVEWEQCAGLATPANRRVLDSLRDLDAISAGRPAAAGPLPDAHAALLRSRPAVRTPRERVSPGSGERIVSRQRMRSRRTGLAAESMYRFVLWLVSTVEKSPRRQRSLQDDRRRRSTRSKLAGLSPTSAAEAELTDLRVDGVRGDRHNEAGPYSSGHR